MGALAGRTWVVAPALLASVAIVTCLAQDSGAGADAAFKKAKKNHVRTVRVRKIRPRNGRTFVPIDTDVVIRFSRPVAPESIDTTTIKFRRLLGDDIPWTAEFRKDGKQVVLHPGTFLDPGRDYEVEIKFGVVSDRGELLKREDRAIFYTDATVPPFQFVRPEQFADVGSSMFEGRAAHSATLLDDGRVLLAGGQSDYVRVNDTADLFDPVDNKFRAAPSRLTSPRAYHVAVRVAGAAMLLGGWDGAGAMSTTDIFDPSTGDFLAGPELASARDFTAAVTLQDGRVLVVGGLEYSSGKASYVRSAEILDPASGGWRPTLGQPNERRAGHVLTLLDDGRVLITGGQSGGLGAAAEAELFDPDTETFTYTGTPGLGFRQLHTATLLSDGRVLIADGGNGRTELYDPVADRFFDAGGSSFVRRTRSTAIWLPGDKVLLLGGFAANGSETLILDSMDLYLPYQGGGFGRVVHVDYVMNVPRAGHTATTLADGRTLIAGGFGSADDFSLTSGVIFSPQ